MPNSSLTGVVEEPEAWAEIRAHDLVMRYRRLGVGRSLLFLDSRSEAEICPELRDALAGDFRLIVPELPGANVHLAGWLADLLEGIGASDVGIVAAERYCVTAIELALLGVDQIARVVIVCPESRGHSRRFDAWEHGALESASRRANVPMLLVHRGQSLAEIAALVRSFFGEN
jgi:hypothetical protein